MKTNKLIDQLAAGMAIFAMYFGAGNIIFPLALGQYALDKTPFALVGLLITAVAMPFGALLTMFLYRGEIAPFFGRLGKIPGLFLAGFTISLLGPLGCAPRCIVLAHSTFSLSFPGIPLSFYSAISCLLIFIFACNKDRILSLIGYFLSPFKIILLVSVIVLGFFNVPEMEPVLSTETNGSLFFHGLKEGYNTMDLIGSFFFAPMILGSILTKGQENEGPAMNRFIFKACLVGALLLSTIYGGFCYLAYLYAPELHGIPSDQLLGAIAIKVLGPKGGMMVSLTVAVACFTTAIALIAAFASFVQKELLAERTGYLPVVIGSLLITFVISTLEFQGIAAFVGPVLEICYPILILLTVYNLIHYFLFNSNLRNCS